MLKSNLICILAFCGSCIAFYIGAGFATMQELLQYEASYGSQFIVVIAVTALIYIFTNLSFAHNGKKNISTKEKSIYKVYCGKKIGTFYDCFSALFCYMSFIVMCGGANSTAMQQWNLPNGVGAVLLTALVILTVIFGLDGILRVLSKLGPILILFILIISVGSIIQFHDNFSQNITLIDNGDIKLDQIGGGNPLISGASYGGFVILWFASFISEASKKQDLKITTRGMLLSAFCIFSVACICCIALICSIDISSQSPIPALSLATNVNSLLGLAFAVVIFIGIYTSAVPLLWTGVRKISKDGTTKYKIITIIAGAIGCLIACYVPYAPLLNVLYGINGYLGFALIALMIVHDIRMFLDTKKQKIKTNN